jgi:DivIVA domain-containing protein
MYWLQLVVIVALLAAVGWLAIGGGGHMSEPVPDRPDLALPNEGMLERTDVDRVRFSVGARGYRMDEVDDVLDRLAHEIELREERIAELEGRAPRSAVDPAAEVEGDGENESEGEDSGPESTEIESAAGPATESETALKSESPDQPKTVSDTENVSAESKAEPDESAAAPVQSSSENGDTAE